MVAVRKDYCDLNPFHAFEGTDEIESLSSLLEQHHAIDKPCFLDKDSKYHEEMWVSAVASGKLVEPFQLVQYRKTWARIIEPGICPTLTQNMGAGGHNVPFYLDIEREQFRKLSVNQCLSLQGFPEKFSFPESTTDAACYRMIGNSVSPKVSQILAEKISTFLEEQDNELKLAI